MNKILKLVISLALVVSMGGCNFGKKDTNTNDKIDTEITNTEEQFEPIDLIELGYEPVNITINDYNDFSDVLEINDANDDTKYYFECDLEELNNAKEYIYVQDYRDNLHEYNINSEGTKNYITIDNASTIEAFKIGTNSGKVKFVDEEGNKYSSIDVMVYREDTFEFSYKEDVIFIDLSDEIPTIVDVQDDQISFKTDRELKVDDTVVFYALDLYTYVAVVINTVDGNQYFGTMIPLKDTYDKYDIYHEFDVEQPIFIPNEDAMEETEETLVSWLKDALNEMNPVLTVNAANKSREVDCKREKSGLSCDYEVSIPLVEKGVSKITATAVFGVHLAYNMSNPIYYCLRNGLERMENNNTYDVSFDFNVEYKVGKEEDNTFLIGKNEDDLKKSFEEFINKSNEKLAQNEGYFGSVIVPLGTFGALTAKLGYTLDAAIIGSVGLGIPVKVNYKTKQTFDPNNSNKAPEVLSSITASSNGLALSLSGEANVSPRGIFKLIYGFGDLAGVYYQFEVGPEAKASGCFELEKDKIYGLYDVWVGAVCLNKVGVEVSKVFKFNLTITENELITFYEDSSDKHEIGAITTTPQVTTTPIESISENNNTDILKNINIGDEISLGSYDGNTLEWIVLDKQGNDILLLSKYIVETTAIETFVLSTTWETSHIRKWLNNSFINMSFSSEEQSLIKTTNVTNSNNPKYGTSGGNNTKDKLFLLSLDEVNKYLQNESERVAYTFEGSEYSWWLRTPGINNYSFVVISSGLVYLDGQSFAESWYTAEGVRPAMWIDITTTPQEITESSSYNSSCAVPTNASNFKITEQKDGTIAIIGYDGTEKSICIPSTINGKSVTNISTDAFYINGLTSVVIPNSVTSIGDYAFGHNNLTSVEIPNSVTTIGEYAFWLNNLTSVEIPNSVTTIGDGAFARNNLTSVEIPNSVTTIRVGAFGYNNLTSVEIPDGIITIEYKAFNNNKLESVEIPNSVTTIGDGAFADNNLTTVEIPDSVISIGNQAFLLNELTSVSVPKNCKIDGNAFDLGVEIIRRD